MTDTHIQALHHAAKFDPVLSFCTASPGQHLLLVGERLAYYIPKSLQLTRTIDKKTQRAVQALG